MSPTSSLTHSSVTEGGKSPMYTVRSPQQYLVLKLNRSDIGNSLRSFHKSSSLFDVANCTTLVAFGWFPLENSGRNFLCLLLHLSHVAHYLQDFTRKKKVEAEYIETEDLSKN